MVWYGMVWYGMVWYGNIMVQVFLAYGGKGWGVRTLAVIPKFTYVFEYVGEVITDEQAEIRGRTRTDNYL